MRGQTNRYPDGHADEERHGNYGSTITTGKQRTVQIQFHMVILLD